MYSFFSGESLLSPKLKSRGFIKATNIHIHSEQVTWNCMHMFVMYMYGFTRQIQVLLLEQGIDVPVAFKLFYCAACGGLEQALICM